MRAHQVSLGHNVAINLGNGLVLINAALIGNHFSIEVQEIAWAYRPLESCIIDTGKQVEIIRRLERFFFRCRSKSQNGSRLSHGFHNQHTRHHRILRKMPCKTGFVHGHILDGMNGLAVIDVFDTINQQKGITMRKNLTDLVDVELWHGDYSALCCSVKVLICASSCWTFLASVSRWRKLAAICNQSPCCRLGKTPVY